MSLPFSLSFSMDDAPRLLVLVLVATVVAYLSDLITGGRAPLRWFGTILTALLGEWLALEVVRPGISGQLQSQFQLQLPTEPTLDSVMLVTAALGAFAVSLVWCLLSIRLTRRG